MLTIYFFLWWLASFAEPQSMPKMKLSDYGFFDGEIAKQIPGKNVTPYSLKTPLFTDYAEKLRFVFLPDGKKAEYNPKEVFEFPVGSALIKTFYYPIDFRKPQKGRRLVETRVLLHEEKGWKAYPYVWNDEQTEAFLEVAGETTEVKYINLEGKKKKHAYAVPNVNQCKGCHNRNENLSPIGPSARQLNSKLEIPSYLDSEARVKYNEGNQLNGWSKVGLVHNLPESGIYPEIANWLNKDSSLESRARAWLDINCAHCHRLEGPANTSGLFLDIHNTDETSLGILKSPVATGRASGDLKYDIVPGNAETSILIKRISSTDPGIMMPELGRKTVHEESVQLLRDWINQMPTR